MGSVNLSTTHTAAGTYSSDSWSFTGAANYNNIGSTTITDTINKATPTVTVTVGSYTYSGSAQGPNSFTTSPAGDTGTPTWSYVGVSGTTYGPSATPPTLAGSYTAQVTALTSDANFNSSSSSATAFTIGKANATFTVTPYTVTYDGSAHTASVSAITGVNGETGATVGSVNLSTTHTAAGTYSSDSWSFTGAANYNNIGSTTITDTINQATLTFDLTSSEYPAAGYKDNLTFTADSFPADASGTVQFQTNGVNLGSAVTLSGSSAVSDAAAGLPRATTNVVAAVYSGDNNYLSLTNTLTQTVTNHPPVAAAFSVNRTAGLSLQVALTNLAAHWSDADGDTINLVGVGQQSTNHTYLQDVSWSGTIITNTANFNHFFIYYTNSPNLNDQFTYTISDNYGGTNTGTVSVIVNAGALFGQSNPQTTAIPGGIQMTFYGIPGDTYVVQRELTLDDNWINLSTNTPVTGPITITDTNNPSAYYRLLWQP